MSRSRSRSATTRSSTSSGAAAWASSIAAVHDDGTEAAVKTVRIANESTLESIRREIQMLRELAHPGRRRDPRPRRRRRACPGTRWICCTAARCATTCARGSPSAVVEATTDDAISMNAGPRSTPAARRAVQPAPTARRRTRSRTSRRCSATICEPLAYVHGQGVVHRDLSPVNIFLVGPERPVLFDFGLAAQFRTDSARDVLEVGGMHARHRALHGARAGARRGRRRARRHLRARLHAVRGADRAAAVHRATGRWRS